jgi:hypothetical protein
MTENEKAERELLDRLQHFYGKTDGTMDFPNSLDGDMLKLTYKFLTREDN